MIVTAMAITDGPDRHGPVDVVGEQLLERRERPGERLDLPGERVLRPERVQQQDEQRAEVGDDQPAERRQQETGQPQAASWIEPSRQAADRAGPWCAGRRGRHRSGQEVRAPRIDVRRALGFAGRAVEDQEPRSSVHAATQSSWVLQVVAESSSAQLACGVLQYEILS